MAISIEDFKRAFADNGSEDALKGRGRQVDRALKRLKRAIDKTARTDASADGFKKALVQLITRYKAAKEHANGASTNGAAELDEILRLTEAVISRVEAASAPAASGDAPAALTPPNKAGAGTGGTVEAPAEPSKPEGVGESSRPEADPATASEAPGAQEQPEPQETGGSAGQFTSQVLKRGARGPAVSFLQQHLNDKGAGLEVDGDFGSKTQTAVKKFQKDKQLRVDGVVGPNTWTALTDAGADGANVDSNVAPAPAKDRKPPTPGAKNRPPEPDVEPGRLNVYVLADIGEQAINGATVVLCDDSKNSQTTDASGLATFTVDRGEPHEYRVTAQGFADLRGTVIVPDDVTDLYVYLSGAPDYPPSESPGKVRLLVRALDGATRQPIASANVNVGNESADTDNDGWAELSMAPDKYSFEVSAPFFRPTKGKFKLPNQPGWTLTILLDTISEVSLCVCVRDVETKSLIPGAKVRIIGGDTDETNENGEAAFRLAPGKHKCEASAPPRYKPKTVALDLDGAYEYPYETIHLEPSRGGAKTPKSGPEPSGESAEEVEFSIRVLASSAPHGEIEVFEVKATVRLSGAVAPTFLRSEEEYYYFKGPLGRYTYQISAPGYEEITGDLHVKHEGLVDITAFLIPRIRTLDEDPAVPSADTGLVNVEVAVYDAETNIRMHLATVQVGADSKFKLTNIDGRAEFLLPPGLHPYEAAASDYKKLSGTFRVDEKQGNSLKIPLQPIKPVYLNSRKQALVYVYVQDPDGVAIDEAEVDFGGLYQLTDRNGKTRFNAAPGDWRYKVSKGGFETETGTYKLIDPGKYEVVGTDGIARWVAGTIKVTLRRPSGPKWMAPAE